MSETQTQRRRTEPQAQTVFVHSGEIVEHQGATWQIKEVLDLEQVLAKRLDRDQTKVLEIRELKRPQQQNGTAPAATPPPLDGISDEDWTIARERLKAIKPLLDVPERTRAEVTKRAAEVGQDVATLYRWISKYRTCDKLRALIPERRGWRTGKHRVSTEADAIIERIIEKSYLSHDRPDGQAVIEEVQEMCRKAAVKCPAGTTIRRRLQEVPERRRLQHRGFRKKSREKFQPTPGQFPGAEHPLACVQIDHTKVDIIVVDDTHRRPIGRPWLTLAIDVYSRVVTGCNISLDPPSETAVALCVAQSIAPKDELLVALGINEKWPVWGIPQKIHVDNGSDFRSDNFKKSCEAYGIDLEFRPVKRPEYGGHIERLIGTCMNEVHKLPGTTYSSPSDKGDLNPEKRAAITVEELEKWLFGFFCTVYHRRVHSEIGVTPLDKWEEGLLRGTSDQPAPGLPPRHENPSDILRDFLPRFHRVVHNTGVQIDSVRYYGEALSPWINAGDPHDSRRKRKLTFRRDPRNISKIWFYDPEQKQYFALPAANRRFPVTNIWELREAKRRIRQQGEHSEDQEQLIRSINALRGQRDEAVEKTKKARRDAQRQKEHRRKTASEGAEAAARSTEPTEEAIDPGDDLLDEPPAEGFGTW